MMKDNERIFNRLLIRKRGLLGQTPKNRQTDVSQERAADELDRASNLIIQTTGFALDRKRLRELRRVEDAIARWRRGSYGRCVSCGDGIEKGRLAAVPETEFCLECKQTLERKEYAYTH
jgi:DnaK suppressor protein